MTKEEISFFDTIAPSWDGMERLSTPGKVNEILDIIGVEKGMDVLDLGTGTGVLLPFPVGKNRQRGPHPGGGHQRGNAFAGL